MDNEINLNTEDNCRKSCGDYSITKHYHCAYETFCAGRDDQWDTAKTLCNGSVLNCQYMGGDLSFCLSVRIFFRQNVIIEFFTIRIVAFFPATKFTATIRIRSIR